MSRFIQFCVALGSFMLLVGCSSNTVQYGGPYSARWVKRQINLYEMPTREAASRVTRKLTYAGEPAYLIPSPCCDKFDYLYDSRGVLLCAPSGGFTGRGDGNCREASEIASSKDH